MLAKTRTQDSLLAVSKTNAYQMHWKISSTYKHKQQQNILISLVEYCFWKTAALEGKNSCQYL